MGQPVPALPLRRLAGPRQPDEPGHGHRATAARDLGQDCTSVNSVGLTRDCPTGGADATHRLHARGRYAASTAPTSARSTSISRRSRTGPSTKTAVPAATSAPVRAPVTPSGHARLLRPAHVRQHHRERLARGPAHRRRPGECDPRPRCSASRRTRERPGGFRRRPARSGRHGPAGHVPRARLALLPREPGARSRTRAPGAVSAARARPAAAARRVRASRTPRTLSHTRPASPRGRCQRSWSGSDTPRKPRELHPLGGAGVLAREQDGVAGGEVGADAHRALAARRPAPGVGHDGLGAVDDAQPGAARARTPVDLLVVGEERLVERGPRASSAVARSHMAHPAIHSTSRWALHAGPSSASAPHRATRLCRQVIRPQASHRRRGSSRASTLGPTTATRGSAVEHGARRRRRARPHARRRC